MAHFSDQDRARFCMYVYIFNFLIFSTAAGICFIGDFCFPKYYDDEWGDDHMPWYMILAFSAPSIIVFVLFVIFIDFRRKAPMNYACAWILTMTIGIFGAALYVSGKHSRRLILDEFILCACISLALVIFSMQSKRVLSMWYGLAICIIVIAVTTSVIYLICWTFSRWNGWIIGSILFAFVTMMLHIGHVIWMATGTHTLNIGPEEAMFAVVVANVNIELYILHLCKGSSVADDPPGA